MMPMERIMRLLKSVAGQKNKSGKAANSPTF